MYNKDKSLGDRCYIRSGVNELKCLLKRSNGTVYWASKNKSGKGQKKCEDWTERCQHSSNRSKPKINNSKKKSSIGC